MKRVLERNRSILYLLLVFIITIPAFFALTKNGYFTMHDDQHIARLFLLDQGISQGIAFPRWVDGLGFGYGYPLYNFYPPLVYYVAELFHLIGFNLIWSIKLTFIVGYVLAAVGIYLLIKSIYDRLTGLVGAVLYTYFFYHSVNAYVRGALAEFFSMSVLPFLFHSMYLVYKKPNLRNGLYFGSMLAAIILTHPLIAFPSVIYIGIFSLFYLFRIQAKDRLSYVKTMAFSGLWGLALSSFSWLPSMMERKFTKVNDILLTELADYSIHFIYPQQLLNSLFSYGGSLEGPVDGFTFQLGKVHIALVLAAIVLIVVLIFRKKKSVTQLHHSWFFIGLLGFSLFMTLEVSKPVWQLVNFLSYLQFPWRFLTFTAIFISVVGALGVYYSKLIVPEKLRYLGAACIIVATIFIYHKYFVPQSYIEATDADLTSQEEISWVISRTSFEFVPKGVVTKKSELSTTILDIDREDIATQPYQIIKGTAEVTYVKEDFEEREYQISAREPFTFRLNTFNFPYWSAYKVEEGTKEQLPISDDNNYKLITLHNLPAGNYNLQFVFENTPVRTITEVVTLLSFLGAGVLLYFKKKEFLEG